jgi:hypothetical protein
LPEIKRFDAVLEADVAYGFGGVLLEVISWLGSVGAYRSGWLGFVSIGWLG